MGLRRVVTAVSAGIIVLNGALASLAYDPLPLPTLTEYDAMPDRTVEALGLAFTPAPAPEEVELRVRQDYTDFIGWYTWSGYCE